MNSLTEMLGVIPDLAGLSGGPSLVVRWTALLALGWATHAALAWRNPRWRVALWRTVAVGVAAIPILTGVPRGVHWTLPARAGPQLRPLWKRCGLFRTRQSRVAGSRAGGRTPAGPELRRRSGNVGARLDAGRDPGRLPHTAEVPVGTAHEGQLKLTRPVGLWLVILWAVGVMLLGSRYVWQVRCLGGIIARSDAWPTRRSRNGAASRSKSNGLPSVDVSKVGRGTQPCLARAWRPVILLPERLVPTTTGRQTPRHPHTNWRDARGRDLAWNDALHLVSILLWFHPLVWRIRQAHASACDAICDAVAADQLGDVASYGRCSPGSPSGPRERRSRGAWRWPDSATSAAESSYSTGGSSVPATRKFAVPAAVTLGLCVTLIGVVRFTALDRSLPPQRAGRSGCPMRNRRSRRPMASSRCCPPPAPSLTPPAGRSPGQV